MKSKVLLLLPAIFGVCSLFSQKSADTGKRKAKNSARDLFADTWVGTDALGRSMPGIDIAGPVKKDKERIVGIFYITWHSDQNAALKSPYSGDVTKVLAADPDARTEAKNPQWKEGTYHWGEPEAGYFLSRDEYVIRKDMSMLSDAGVDVLVMDVTNAVRYWSEWETLFTVMQQMKAEGNKVPKFCFWAFNGPVLTVVQDLYDKVYKLDKYKDLWYYWDKKPLLLYNGTPQVYANGPGVQNPNPHYDSLANTDKKNPHYGDPDFTQKFYTDYTKDIKRTFTLRTMWWGYYKWAGQRFVGTENNWSFGYDLGDGPVRKLPPDSLVSCHQGKLEEVAVTPAQHPFSLVGKSWSRADGEPTLNKYDMPDSAFVPWLNKTVKNPEGYGIYFQERWDEALKLDPPFLYLNDWNEWTAGKYQPAEGTTFDFMRRKNSFYFVDQYNAEFNRSIQPMKGGYTDNYYMQMAENIRRYKGIRPVPQLRGLSRISIDGRFNDWHKVKNEYRDTRGDVVHRDFDGYGGSHYRDSSGRNDILTSKVAVDKTNLFFYAQTDSALTSSDGKNWMLLLIDSDQNPNTGWFGYDYLVNKKVIDDQTTTMMRYDSGSSRGHWVDAGKIGYRYSGKELELAIPRELLGLTNETVNIDFHWSDNIAELKDPISLATSGDSAPNRRFNYRCSWKQ